MKTNHAAFINCIQSLNEKEFNTAPAGKWYAGQTLDHIRRAVSTLSLGMMLPRFVFALLFGKSKRSSVDYDAVVARYQGILAAGAKAHGRYLPNKISFATQQKPEAKLQQAVDRICRSLETYSEEQLDEYILPHPLLGRITIREMMYFTMYHAMHHLKIVLRDAKANVGIT